VRVFSASGALRHEMHGHTGNILSLAWIDNTRFVTSSVDGTLRQWDAQAAPAWPSPTLACAATVDIAPDGRILAGDDAGRIAVISGEETIFVRPMRRASRSWCWRAMAPGWSRWAMTGRWPCGIWHRGSPARDRPRNHARADLGRAAAVCPDGRIAVGTFGGSWARFDPDSALWDLEGVEAGEAINALIDTPRGLASIGDAGRLRLGGICLAEMGSLCNFLTVCDGRLFTGGHLGELYDGASGALLHRHHSPLNCGAAFQRRGEHLAVGTYTGEILVFAVTPSFAHVATISAHTNAVKSLAVGGGALFSACANTTLAWHDLEDLTETRRQPKAHTRIANAACVLAAGPAGPPVSPPSGATGCCACGCPRARAHLTPSQFGQMPCRQPLRALARLGQLWRYGGPVRPPGDELCGHAPDQQGGHFRAVLARGRRRLCRRQL
jgi:hypothetical protein